MNDTWVKSGRGSYGSMRVVEATTDPISSPPTKPTTELQRKSERWSFGAGILYAIIIICGITSEVGLRGNLLVDYQDADATMAKIQSNPCALRWSMVLDLIMSTSDSFLSILLGAVLVVNGAD